MIDMHTHILPGWDDGAETMEEAVEMAQISADSGVRFMVVTPHSNQAGRFENYASKELYAAIARLQEALDERHIPIKLYPGMEIYASGDIGKKIQKGRLIGLNESRYYLVEFSFQDTPEHIEGILKQVKKAGGVPVIAHPERYSCVQRCPRFIHEWLCSGCLTQLNRGSVQGRFGGAALNTARYLIESGWVSCIASDAHGALWRTPRMDDIREWLEIYYGVDYAERVLDRNPQLILEDKKIHME